MSRAPKRHHKAPMIGKRYVSSQDKSPTREKTGQNGSAKVIRVHVQCICGEEWHVLAHKRSKSLTICPGCRRIKFTIDADRKNETFSVDVDLYSGPENH